MYVWSARLVATSNEALLLTLLIQKLATTMEKLQWKNLVGKEKLGRNFDGTDAQHPFDQTPLRRQLLLKLRRWCLLCLARSTLGLFVLSSMSRTSPSAISNFICFAFFFLGNFTLFFWKLRFFFWKLRFFFGKLDLPFFWNFWFIVLLDISTFQKAFRFSPGGGPSF